MNDILEKLPDLPYTIKFIVVLLSGVILLRLSGKRSIAQMTVPEAVLMIAIGTLLIQPIAPKSEWGAIYGGALLIGGMVLLAFLQIWFPRFRKYAFGVPSILVTNGKVDLNELKKCRMTTDQLKMRLRQLQVGNLSDVKSAVLEPSGVLSIALKENKKSAEKEDIQFVLQEIADLKKQIQQQSATYSADNTLYPPNITGSNKDSLFEEASKEDQQNQNIPMH